MPTYQDKPTITFDFTQSPPSIGSGGTHTGQILENNLLKPDIFNTYEGLFNDIVNKIWGDGGSTITQSLVEKVDALSTTVDNIETNKSFFPQVMFFSHKEGIFDVQNYPASSSDELFKTQHVFEISSLNTSDMVIEGGQAYKKDAFILRETSTTLNAANVASDLSLTAGSSGDQTVYIYSLPDVTNNVIKYSLSNPTITDDRALVLYKITLFDMGDHFEWDSTYDDLRQYINEPIFRTLLMFKNTDTSAISDNKVPLQTPDATSPIEIEYDSGNKQALIKLNISTAFSINAGVLDLNDGTIGASKLDINAFDSNLFEKNTVITLKLSSDFQSTNGSLELADGIIESDHLTNDIVDQQSIDLDTNNRIKVRLSNGITIDTNGLTLNVDSNMFDISTVSLQHKYHSDQFDYDASGLYLKDNVIKVSNIDYGTGANQLKINSDGYALFY